MRRALVLLIAFATVLGCHKPELPLGGLPDPSPDMPRSVVSLSPSTTELCASLGLGFRLAGRTSACNFPTSVKNVPAVADVKPDYEKITEIHPGVIIFDDSLYSPSDIQQMHQKLDSTGVHFVEVKGDTINEFTECLYEVGKAFHSESQASDYVDNIEAARSVAIVDPLPSGTKVAVLLPDPKGLGMLAGKSSFQSDIVKASGGNLIGPDGDKFADVSPEAFVQMNPDYIVLATTKNTAEADIDRLLKNPQIQSVNAIKNKKIVTLDQDVVVRRGSRVDKLIDAMHRQLKKVAS